MIWILTKIFRLRFYVIHSTSVHGHSHKWWVFSYQKPNPIKEVDAIHDWTDYQ